jgi:hypothetical protein
MPATRKKISFIVHFSRSKRADGRAQKWMGQIQEVEQGMSRAVLHIENLVDEFAQYGVHLEHGKPTKNICDTCLRAGGYSKEVT